MTEDRPAIAPISKGALVTWVDDHERPGTFHAYGVVIENAVGGAGNDLLIGNDVANVLDGGAGFDTVGYAGAASGVSARYVA